MTVSEVISNRCSFCGAPLRALENGACPFCHTVVASGSGAAPAAPGVPSPAGAGCAVVLTATGGKKINVIKVIRELTGLGLKEAKDLADAGDRGPVTILGGLGPGEAAGAVAELTAAGASAHVAAG